jgi:hypothetical protein
MGGAPSPGSAGKSGSLGGAAGGAGSAPMGVAGAGAAGIPNQGGETNLGGASSVGGESVGGDGGVSPSGPGDINADGCVDLRDWAILGRDFGCALENGGDPRADLQRDGWVDDLDYIILTQHWYEGDHCGPTCEAGGDGGQGGAGGQGATDLNGDGRVDWDDVAALAESYGCDDTCAAPGADLVPDGCVDDRDLDVLTSELGPVSRLPCSGAR